MKKCWLYLTDWNKDLVTEAIESGVDAIITKEEFADKIKELGRISIISSKTGDLIIPDDVEIIEIKNKEDEERAAYLLKDRIVAVKTSDWDIIPIENLIPQSNGRLFSFIRNLKEAELAATIMEKGVAGIVIETEDSSEIRKIVEFIKMIDAEKFNLVKMEITSVKNIGVGDRVCVDTCVNLNLTEGLLVGNSSRGMFLIHAENIENPYVAPRPFRINAGAVHSYLKVPGDKTRYLGELETGDPVLIIDKDGKTFTADVGRSKIEKRPMLIVYAKDEKGESHSVVLQNAETIRLTDTKGEPVSVVSLKPGDNVLGFVEEGGRHFGMAVDESILEK